MYLYHLLRVAVVLVLLSGTASAKTFDRIPDLAQLVRDPIKGTYILVCDREVAWAEAGDFEVVRGSSANVTLAGFRTLKLVLMVRPLREWDKIATTLLVHLCIEEDTTYTIDSGRTKPILRDTDPDNRAGGGGKRTFIPQKTRP